MNVKRRNRGIDMKSEKKLILGFAIGLGSSLLVFAICLNIFFRTHVVIEKDLVNGNQISESQSPEGQTEEEYYNEIVDKVQLLEAYISRFYLDNVDKEKIKEKIYKGVMESLEDPYSVYYTEEEYKSLMESNQGKYVGIGAYVSQDIQTGLITITKPFENGPAYKAGILPGDIIYKIDGQSVEQKEITEVVAEMKGIAGTKVNVEVIREGEIKPLTFTVTRADIEVPTIEYEMLENKVGYIKVTEFDEVTAAQFREAVDDLEKKAMTGLVIDLRDNPGGMLTTVVDMLDRVVGKGLLLSTKDKNGEGSEYKATDPDKLTVPLCVLINKNSASASEVFAGAVQDYKVGTLVGTTSFGKGIVQSIMPLKDGSAIKVTVAHYYTPEGRDIHKVGVTPDVEVELDEEAAKMPVIPKDKDNQLQKAIESLK